MKTTDLGPYLRRHSDSPPTPPALADRVSSIRRKAVVRRRNRVALVAGATVAVLAIAAGVALGVTGRSLAGPDYDPAQLKAWPIRTIDGYPQYTNGYKLVASAHSDPRTGIAQLTTTIDTPYILVETICPDPVYTNLKVNGVDLGGGGPCTPDTPNGSGQLLTPDSGRTTWMTPGTPTTFTMSASSHHEAFTFAVLARVPFTDVPLPPRPAHLAPLSTAVSPPRTLHASEPGDDRAPVSFTATWPNCGTLVLIDSCLQVDVGSSTPGEFRVTVNGIDLITMDVYEYDYHGLTPHFLAPLASLSGLNSIKPGDKVTIKVTPVYVTGPWIVHAITDGSGGI